jgi:NADH-quinone oxidoreductase subunit F
MEQPLTGNIRPDRTPLSLKEYEKAGGYQGVRKALKSLSPEQITSMVKDATLRGRGGAGFPTGLKWSAVPMGADAPRPKYLVINADEMEPGTFKDRLLMEGDPHQLIEGIIVSAYAIQAEAAYIFLRWAYKLSEQNLQKAIAEAYAAGYLGKNILGSGWNLDLYLHLSAGRYMAGEETGLLNALEGKRANPRTKPPYPATVGLWGKPTVVNNVETIANVHHIVNKGADWFKSLSRTNNGGTKLYGVSGRVNKPDAWELPMGVTAREIIEQYAGGMKEGYKLRGVIPGGASTEFLLDEHLDTPMDFDTLPKVGSRLGTGTMIILDDHTCPVAMLENLEHFFAQESCGWCTPCWSGLHWVEEILHDIEAGNGEPGDLEILESHTRLLAPGHTFCAFAPGAVEPLQAALKYYRDDFERHIKEHHCPWR